MRGCEETGDLIASTLNPTANWYGLLERSHPCAGLYSRFSASFVSPMLLVCSTNNNELYPSDTSFVKQHLPQAKAISAVHAVTTGSSTQWSMVRSQSSSRPLEIAHNTSQTHTNMQGFSCDCCKQKESPVAFALEGLPNLFRPTAPHTA